MADFFENIKPWLPCLSTVITSLIVGILSAWLTAHWALKRFRQERWWDRKNEAYKAILKGLHRVKQAAWFYLDIAKSGPVTPKQVDEAVERADAARNELFEARDLFSLLIAPEANAALDHFMTVVNNPDPKTDTDPIAKREKIARAAWECLDEIRKAEEKELRAD